MGTNPINPDWLSRPLVDKNGMASREFSEWLRKQLVAPLAKVVTSNPSDGPIGQIQSSAMISGRTEGIGTTVSGLSSNGSINAATKIVGRTEGIGTTVGQLNSSGQLLSTDEIAADGTGSPLTGGKRAAIALNSNNQLASSFHGTGVNTSSTPNSSATLSNNGTATAITIAASSNQFAPGNVSYSSGSVDPGSFGKSYVYAADPTFAGGAVPYSVSSTPQPQTATEGNVLFGTITTSSGSSKTGGGSTGGTGGQAGGRGYLL